MRVNRQFARMFGLAMLVFLSICPGFGHIKNDSTPFNFPVDENTVVWLFFVPADSYFHPPLIFRVVGENDSRLNSAPIVNLGGRTPYISLTEMRNLVQKLGHTDLSWHESEKSEVPKRIKPGEITDKMQIKIFFGSGTDWALLDPKKICATLAPLDAAFREPRALWEFQLFRVDYGCKVPGFKRDKYPQHDEGNK
jgi:hypothetical protein